MYEAYGKQANYVGCLTFGRQKMHPRLWSFCLWSELLAASFGFISNLWSLVICVKKASRALVEMLFYLIKRFFQMFHSKLHILSRRHGTRTENWTGTASQNHKSRSSVEQTQPPHDYSKLVSIYFKYQSLICFHRNNCLFPLCCKNCLFHHQWLNWHLKGYSLFFLLTLTPPECNCWVLQFSNAFRRFSDI